MKAWLYTSTAELTGTVKPTRKIRYLHVFTGTRVPNKKGTVLVDKSLFKFGAKENYFTPPGQKIFVGTGATPFNIKDIKKWIIKQLISKKFDLRKYWFRI